MKYYSYIVLFMMICVPLQLIAQIVSFPYSESFDSAIAPALPQGWSANGFSISTSTFHSSPNCVSTTGNIAAKSINSPIVDFTNRVPEKLIFWERRSSTATTYRLEVRVSDDGVNFVTLLVRFDTISSTSGYVQRVVDLARSGLQQQSNVRFQWRLFGDNTNNTGVLRIDDVLLTVAIGSDVGFTKISLSPAFITRKDPLTFSLILKNYGLLPASDFSVRLFYDENLDEIAESSEQFFVVNGLMLNPHDSLTCTATYPQLNAGEHRFIATIDFRQDENRTNDTISTIVTVGCTKSDLLINEIMYEPLDGQNEWLELFNRSSQPIDIAKWTFNDKATSSGVNSFVISTRSSIVRTNEFAIVAADSSIFTQFSNIIQTDSTIHIFILNRSNGFSFNNSGDAIVLKDITGQTIDSVAYSPRWHNLNIVDTRGRSLERINTNIDSNDPRNWSTCTNLLGGTPGKANSVMTIGAISNSVISISPNPFSPDGDGFEDFCIIRYNLSMPTSTINLRIYDIKGRLIRTLANSELTGSQGEIIWDGLGNDKQRARIGVYIIFLEATDQSSRKVETAKAVAVVAMRL